MTMNKNATSNTTGQNLEWEVLPEYPYSEDVFRKLRELPKPPDEVIEEDNDL